MNIGKLKRSTQIAIMTGVGSGAVEKTVTGTAPLTLSDSVVGNILGITINGRSDVNAGSIVSVGDNGLTVTTTNSDSTVTTSAVVTTALPLRGVSDTVRDKLTCTADSKQVETVCGEVDLGDLDWTYNVPNAFFVAENALINAIYGQGCICNNYAYSTARPSAMNDKCITLWTDSTIYIKDSDYTDAATFKTAVTGVKLIYPLATPVTTPLTDAEISALTSLSTYDSTTIISVTDNPSITVKYMGKNITRTAPKKRSSRKKKA